MERSCDHNLGIDNFLVESRVLAFLVVGDDESVTLGFQPFANTELILNGTEQTRLFLGPFAAFVENCQNFDLQGYVSGVHDMPRTLRCGYYTIVI